MCGFPRHYYKASRRVGASWCPEVTGLLLKGHSNLQTGPSLFDGPGKDFFDAVSLLLAESHGLPATDGGHVGKTYDASTTALDGKHFDDCWPADIADNRRSKYFDVLTYPIGSHYWTSCPSEKCFKAVLVVTVSWWFYADAIFLIFFFS